MKKTSFIKNKKMYFKPALIIAAAMLLFTSCTSTNKMMREPNVRVELGMDDFTLSNQVTAEATSKKIIGIDWDRLFLLETGTIQKGNAMRINLASIPVIGAAVADQTANYALYQLMQDNPGYDVVYYPQFETTIVKPWGVGIIVRTTTVKVTARLGKLKK